MIPLSFVLKTQIEDRVVWLSSIIPLALATIGIWRSRIEKIKIFFFKKIDHYFALALFGGTAVGSLLLLVRVWFNKNIEMMNFVGAKEALLYFFIYYVLFILLIFIPFLGGEICWRGYLWQKWKSHPFKGGMTVWLLWCLSSIPLVTIPQGIPYMAFYNLMLMPILHFFRYKSGAIGPGALFYASYYSAFIYLRMIFSDS